MARGETLHDSPVELWNVPIYPEARTVAAAGAGPMLTANGMASVSYALKKDVRGADVVAFYREKMPGLGWTELAGAARTDDHVSVVIFKHSETKAMATISYADSTASGVPGGNRIVIGAPAPK